MGESLGCCLLVARLLQLLPDSQDIEGHACDGSGDRGPRLGSSGIVGLISDTLSFPKHLCVRSAIQWWQNWNPLSYRNCGLKASRARIRISAGSLRTALIS